MKELKRYRKISVKNLEASNLWEGIKVFVFQYRWYFALGLLITITLGAILLGMSLERRSRERVLSYELTEVMGEYNRLSSQGITIPSSSYGPLLKKLEDLYARTRGTALYPVVLVYLFHIHIEQRNFDAALGVSQELREVSRGHPRFYAVSLYQLGKTYEFLGDYQTAILFYRQASEVQGSPFGEFLNEEIKRLEQPALPQEVVMAFSPRPVTPQASLGRPTQPARIEIPIKELLEKMEK